MNKRTYWLDGAKYSEDGKTLLAVKEDLEQLIVADGTEVIGKGACSYCTHLASVVLPEALLRIEDTAFEGCSKLASITFPSSLKYIGSNAFHGCSWLKQIVLNEGLLELGDEAFSFITHLKEFTIPSTLQKMGINPLYIATYPVEVNCKSPHFKTENGILYSADGTRLISNFSKTEDVVVPDGVVEICDHAGLKGNVKLPDTLRRIGNEAFSEISVEGIGLPPYLEEIGDEAFGLGMYGATYVLPPSLRKIGTLAFGHRLPINIVCQSEHFKVVDDLLYTANGHTLIASLKKRLDFEVIKECREIAPKAFCSQEDLETIVLPKGLKKIGEGAFSLCGWLSLSEFPPQLRVVGKGAFSNCRRLRLDILPDSLKSVGEWAFGGCDGRKGLHIPSSLEVIRETTFMYSSLRRVTIPSHIKAIEKEGFAYSEHLTEVEFQGPSLRFGNFVFTRCRKLRRVIFHEGFTRLSGGYGVFDRCDRLSDIYLPSTLQNISKNFFEGIEDGVKVHVPKGSKDKFRNLLKGLDVKIIDNNKYN